MCNFGFQQTALNRAFFYIFQWTYLRDFWFCRIFLNAKIPPRTAKTVFCKSKGITLGYWKYCYNYFFEKYTFLESWDQFLYNGFAKKWFRAIWRRDPLDLRKWFLQLAEIKNCTITTFLCSIKSNVNWKTGKHVLFSLNCCRLATYLSQKYGNCQCQCQSFWYLPIATAKET